ncbi:MAG: VCBS repeat-containing protein [Ignavibacteriae bacterium]|nr:VCBS repeat-containing protein [Ignavibacteriota bacterium]
MIVSGLQHSQSANETFSGGPDSAVPFRYVLIDAQNPRHPHTTSVGDISGDGLPDVVNASGDGYRDGIYWYKYPAWTKTVVDTGSFSTDQQLGDVDGDGDQDIVITRGIDYGISVWWYENPRPAGDPSTNTWTRHFVANATTHDIELGDINQDGKLDIVVRNNTLTIFFQEPGLTWRSVIISQRPWEGTALGDIDHDGDLDIAINSYWYQNPRPAGDPRFDVWTERVINTNWPVSVGVHIRDINADGRNDVLFAPSAGFAGRLSWYETSNPLTGPWVEHSIDASIECVHTFKTGDIDLDGDIDVVAGEGHYCNDPDNISVYLNNGTGLSWVEQIVATSGIHNLRIADMGSDGDIDIVGSNAHDVVNSHGSPLEMWENLTIDGVAPPSIVTHPANQSVALGETATFSVSATGSTLSYQWQKNSVNIPDAASTSYTTPAAVQGDNGAAFRCVVSNALGTATSNSATLTVLSGPPVFTTQPAHATRIVGQTATFTVVAAGPGPIQYLWQMNGANIPGASGSSYVTPAATANENGTAFRCIATNSFGTTLSNIAILTVVPQPTRVSDGIQALYTFEEGGGTTVNDVSGVGAPLNLTIANPANVTWLDGFVSVNAGTIISSTTNATKVFNACTATDEITAEAWIRSASLAQSGPARIMTMSVDLNNRNFTLGQGATGGATDAFELRRRTSATNANGTPALITASGTLTTDLHHVVVTRNNAGATKIYVDGIELSSETVAGDFSTWTDYKLALANELTVDRPWLGELHLAAIYNRGLSQTEVVQNYNAGSSGISVQSVYVPLRLMLQGAYDANGDSMRTSIRTLLPLSQPYTGAPWNYAGTESVPSIPDDVVDWVLIELRTGTASNTKVAARAGFVKSNGTVVDIDGSSSLSFDGVASGNYYLVVRHRNHLPVMSATAVSLSQAGNLYDFSSSQTMAFGSSALSQLENGVFGLVAGDVNLSAIVSSSDANAVFSIFNQSGYLLEDANLSGITTATDANAIFSNLNRSSQVP